MQAKLEHRRKSSIIYKNCLCYCSISDCIFILYHIAIHLTFFSIHSNTLKFVHRKRLNTIGLVKLRMSVHEP
nr:hypothetical transcript [Hymenolepis microstoma]